MRVGRIELTGGFFLVMAWLNYLDVQSIVPLAMLSCAAHELGHYITIRLLGGDIKLIRLTAIGAEMMLARPLNYWQEGVAALSGPGVNLLLALFFCQFEWGAIFAGLNVVLGCFNLMPIKRLDGGRVLHCTLSMLSGGDVATVVGDWLSTLFTAVIFVLGLLLTGVNGNVTMLLVALWLLVLFCNEKKRGIRACHTANKQVK